MTLLDYMGQNAPPLPPVIEPGRIGSIHRYCHEQRIIKPLKHAPATLARTDGESCQPGRNEAKQDKNRAEILRLIAAGVCYANQIAEIAKISTSTVWNHLKPLESDGLIIINRALKPWPINLPLEVVK